MSYWRYSYFYLFFFASLGAMLPYWSLYLQSLGFSPADIGELMAIIMATKIIAPNLWGWLADHTGQRVMIIRVATLAALLAFSGVFLAQGYWWMALVMSVYSFFWNAALPLFEAATMSRLGEETHRYSSIRLWGSVGFILAVVVVGMLLDWLGVAAVPVVVVTMLVGVFFSSLMVAGEGKRHSAKADGSIMAVLKRPDVMIVLVVCFLLQASHGPYYTFFSVYLEQQGYSSSEIGQLWALGVGAEVLVFLMMHRWLPRYGVRFLLLLSLALTSLRWLLIGWGVEWLAMLILAQVLHAASFGIYHAVAIHMIHHFFTGRHQGRGQALYSSLSFGVGGALGALASGYLWDGVGADITFTIAAVTSLAAWLLAWRYVKFRH